MVAVGGARYLSMGWNLEDFQCAGFVRSREVGASWTIVSRCDDKDVVPWLGHPSLNAVNGAQERRIT
jgi:hypothetical protein